MRELGFLHNLEAIIGPIQTGDQLIPRGACFVYGNIVLFTSGPTHNDEDVQSL